MIRSEEPVTDCAARLAAVNARCQTFDWLVAELKQSLAVSGVTVLTIPMSRRYAERLLVTLQEVREWVEIETHVAETDLAVAQGGGGS